MFFISFICTFLKNTLNGNLGGGVWGKQIPIDSSLLMKVLQLSGIGLLREPYSYGLNSIVTVNYLP